VRAWAGQTAAVPDPTASPALTEPTASAPAFASVTRDVVRVWGPDAIGYLQGQLSQDVAGLPVGASAWSFVLQPQGKVDAWVRVERTAEDAVSIDVDAGWGAATKARIERFKLRTKAEVELEEGVAMVAVRGIALAGGLAAGWPGVAGTDHRGEQRPDGLPVTAVELDAEAYEALRIAHGVPAMGAELHEDTIPAEAGQWVIDASVSFSKGCYTGQELVARIDSRGGNVPRRLRTIAGGTSVPAAGAEVQLGDLVVGTVTSAVAGPDRTMVGLAYVKRAIEVPCEVVIDGGTVQLGRVPGG